jgi:hypothetical protein
VRAKHFWLLGAVILSGLGMAALFGSSNELLLRLPNGRKVGVDLAQVREHTTVKGKDALFVFAEERLSLPSSAGLAFARKAAETKAVGIAADLLGVADDKRAGRLEANIKGGTVIYDNFEHGIVSIVWACPLPQ